VYETLVRQRSVQGTFYLGFAFRAQAVELMSYKVLVVDDSKLARMAVAKLLRALHPDWTHIEAASADEALAVLKEKEADLVVVDFNMPGRDGLDLASEFRETVPTMPMALISANHQQEIVDRTHAVGATFLPKPLTEQALGEFLAGAVQQLKAAGA
jgi:CheY-like chemotaxis protein